MGNNIKHIAVIMDGNRRWARSQNLDFDEGYQCGADAVKEAIKGCIRNQVENLTCYVFSAENWQRSDYEVAFLKGLLLSYLNNNAAYFLENKIKFQVLGDYKKFGEEISEKIENLIAKTKDYNTIVVNMALNYGAKQEILRAVNLVINDAKSNPNMESLTESQFAKYMYIHDMPDPDFIIRTGGEKRISNFLLWQIAYTELIFLDIMWPEFTEKHIDKAIEEFKSRQIRKGK